MDGVAFHYGGKFYNCSSNKAILKNNLLILHRLEILKKDSVLTSGYTYNDIRYQYMQKLSAFNERNMHSLSPNIQAAITYDAVWTLAMAINMTETSALKSSVNINSFQYGNTNFTDQMKLSLDKIEFRGASGIINFDDEYGYAIVIAL